MPTEIHEETDRYRIEFDDEIDAVVHTWKEFTSDRAFRDGANALLEFFRKADTSKMIVDTSGIRAHDDEDKRWLREEWMQRAIEAGLEASATVHNDSAISKMDMEKFTDRVDDLPYDAFLTDDIDEAREWMAER